MTKKITPKGKLFQTGSKNPEPVRFKKTKDKWGTVWTCNPSAFSKTKELEVWVDRKPEEKFNLRQENNGQVDLISLDLGQAYDLLRALGEALDTND